MKNITDIFNTAYDKVLQGNYKYLYVAVDVHNTVLMRSKTRCLCNGSIIEMEMPLPTNDIFFHKAKEVLQRLSSCDRIRLILYTSSTDEEIKHYLELFRMHNIKIHFVNSNPEVVSDVSYADFSKKFYFDILLDDKAGFDPRNDWYDLFLWTESRLPGIIDQNHNIHDGQRNSNESNDHQRNVSTEDIH